MINMNRLHSSSQIRTTIISHITDNKDARILLVDSIFRHYPNYVQNHMWICNGLENHSVISQVKTEFVLYINDGFIFTDKTDIGKLEGIINNTDNDIIGFAHKSNDYGSFSINEETIRLISQKNAIEKYDYIPPAFIARTSSLINNSWSEKIDAHLSFLYDHHKHLKIDHTEASPVQGTVEKYCNKTIEHLKGFMATRNISKATCFGETITI